MLCQLSPLCMEHFSVKEPSQPVVLTAGDKHLPPADAVEDKFLPFGVQLTEHIIQQQHRVLPQDLPVDLPCRQLQRQRRRPGLALGGIGPGAQAPSSTSKSSLWGPDRH